MFEDGAAYRGHLKTKIREIVKICFRDLIDPQIEFAHNSSQRAEIISENISKSINTFHMGLECDDQVFYPLSTDIYSQYHFRAVRRILVILPSSWRRKSSTIVENLTPFPFFSLMSFRPFQNVVLL